MDREEQKINRPFYHRIYTDLIIKKYPEKIEECKNILSKKELSFLDIISLNEKIFGNNKEFDNQRLRSYNEDAIFRILEYQKKHNLNNSQLAIHFKLSRNTVARWKKNFSV